jgi:hypothetical protein
MVKASPTDLVKAAPRTPDATAAAAPRRKARE